MLQCEMPTFSMLFSIFYHIARLSCGEVYWSIHQLWCSNKIPAVWASTSSNEQIVDFISQWLIRCFTFVYNFEGNITISEFDCICWPYRISIFSCICNEWKVNCKNKHKDLPNVLCAIRHILKTLWQCVRLSSLLFIVIGMTLVFVYTLQNAHGNCILPYFQILCFKLSDVEFLNCLFILSSVWCSCFKCFAELRYSAHMPTSCITALEMQRQ